LPETAGLPPFICFSTGYPERKPVGPGRLASPSVAAEAIEAQRLELEDVVPGEVKATLSRRATR